ncbi:MAG: O-antigen ligase family protein [Candidatus Aminicenantes bacterium]|nr:O-antigen ligase family protein [Candidatus Aminicenantes bacterium]
MNRFDFLAVGIALFLLLSMVSISISQVFLGLSFLILIVLLVRMKIRLQFPSFFWGAIAYCVLSLISSLLSVNPEVSLYDSRKLLLFLIIPIAYMGLRKPADIRRANTALLVSGCISIVFSLGYSLIKAAPGERIQGFMGHYMTEAGVMLIFSALALSMFVFSRNKLRWLWGLAFCLSLVVLLLTSTRSAWVGVVIAAAVVLFFFKPKTLVIMPVAVALVLVLSPKEVKQRAASIFSLKSYSNAQRIEYMRTGIRIIREYPFFGTGPDTVDMVFQHPKYHLSEEAKRNVHLHNNIIQIAAERGIPTLIVWLAFMAWAFSSLIRLLPNRDPLLFPLTVAAVAAFLAHFAAGLFEYNFADSEVAALFFFIITVPFAQAKILANREPPAGEP